MSQIAGGPSVLALGEFVADRDFQLAVVAAAIASALVAAAGRWASRDRAKRPLPVAGLAIAVPAVAVIAVRLDMPRGAMAGLVALGLAGALADGDEIPLLPALLVALPGAWLVGWHGDLVPVTWIRATVLGVTLLGGAAVASFDHRFERRGYAPALVALSTAGVYYTVPDPYEALVLFGCAVPVALLGWPRVIARFGASGALVVVGLLAWVVARDGFGRQSSIIGGVASLGLLALEPCWRAFRQRAWSPLDLVRFKGWRWPFVLGVHLACVFWASRVAGVRDSAPYVAPGPLWRGRVAGAVSVVLMGVAVASIGAALAWHLDPTRRRNRGQSR